MNFTEEPLHYHEALESIQTFERRYKIASADLFGAPAASKPAVDVHCDDLYEWRSYYEFVSRVDAKLGQLLAAGVEFGEDDLVYSGSSRSSNSTVSKKNQDLSLAA